MKKKDGVNGTGSEHTVTFVTAMEMMKEADINAGKKKRPTRKQLKAERKAKKELKKAAKKEAKKEEKKEKKRQNKKRNVIIM